MIKLLLTGLWVCAVTLGAVYGSVQMSKPKPVVDEATQLRNKSELVKGENINVPVLSKGAVQGYFITRISFLMDKEKIKGVHLPTTEMMTDELFTLLVGNKMVDLGNTKAFDLDGFVLVVGRRERMVGIGRRGDDGNAEQQAQESRSHGYGPSTAGAMVTLLEKQLDDQFKASIFLRSSVSTYVTKSFVNGG